MSEAIEVQIASGSEAPDEADLRAWAAHALAAIGEPGGGLTIRAVDADEQQALNRDFRGRDYATNVLSFPLDDLAPEAADDLDAPYWGDLAVCAPVVAREAEEQGKALPGHWCHMIVHGVLHLAGFDHERDDEAERMEATERRIVVALGFDDPYASEAGRETEVSDAPARG